MNYYIIAVIIVAIILAIILLVYMTSQNKTLTYKVGKIVEYNGMFKRVSNLSIGHDKNAPIFHARPYFGDNKFNSGMGEYFGVIKINDDESVYLEFPSMKNKLLYYEVNIFEYPSWEQIGDTLLNVKYLSLGTSIYDTIKIKSGKEIIIFITGFMDNKLMNSWLSQCKVYTEEQPEKSNSLYRTNDVLEYPNKEDKHYYNNIKSKYENFIKEFIHVNSNYKINMDIISQKTHEDSFPPTNGVSESIIYNPNDIDEILIIIIPNRNITLQVPDASYLQVNADCLYFQHGDDIVDFYTYQVTSLDEIHIEERFPVSHLSQTLPFYMFVATKQ